MKDIIEFSLADVTDVTLEQLRTFFINLDSDTFDTRLYGLKPFRQRKVIYIKYCDGKITYTRKSHFKQNVADGRSEGRTFTKYKLNASEKIVFEKLIHDTVKFVKSKNRDVHNFDITVHFVQINASESGASNSPEGIHRDEFDILVPCLVVDRVNIKGGASRAFIKGKTVYKKIMTPGNGLIINEGTNPDIYHDVEPIYLKNMTKPGYRRIIGIDINIL